MYVYGIFLALKSGSFAYFTTANPCMKYGGAFGMDKTKILENIDKHYIPKGFTCESKVSIEELVQKINEHQIDFPIICKPNVGERGIGVEKVDSESDLEAFLKEQSEDLLIQEFIDYPIELGIFYHRYPSSKSDAVTSVVRKEFLTITGNGKSKFGDLVKSNIRAKGRMKYLRKKYNSKWNQIIPSGLVYKLEPIGNHNRGTKFIDGNQLINDRLLLVFRNIAKQIDGFYYGRFDIKVKSLEDLYAGTNIKIIELNGTNSEPAHIYDPDYSLIQAYKDIVKHMRIIYEISSENRKLGIKPDPFSKVLKGLYNHLFAKK
jgi:hypothetical protein